MSSASIIICAHNEERTLKALLHDVLNQKFPENWDLREIIVVADGCTDNTEQVVFDAAADNNHIRLLALPSPNRGKSCAFNHGISEVTDDAVILLDADIRLAHERVCASLLAMLDTGADLASGNDVPDPAPVRHIGHAASLGRHLIKQELKRQYGVYTCVGRVLAMRRNFYSGLEIPDLPGEDNFRYFTAVRTGCSYVYVPDAVVFFTPATSLQDYVQQHTRFWHGVAAFKKFFPNDAAYGTLGDHMKAVLTATRHHPIIMATWGFAAVIGQLMYAYQRYIARLPQTGKWDIASSTK